LCGFLLQYTNRAIKGQAIQIVFFTASETGIMDEKPFRAEVGIVWRQESQLIRMTLERMVQRNTLSKLSVIADEIGMSEDEFRSKVSVNPRTPLSWNERISIEQQILERDGTEYLRYLQYFHLTSAITIKDEDGEWVR